MSIQALHEITEFEPIIVDDVVTSSNVSSWNSTVNTTMSPISLYQNATAITTTVPRTSATRRLPWLRAIYPYAEPQAWAIASVAQTIAVWLVMLVTIDRYVAVCLPMKASFYRGFKSPVFQPVQCIFY